MIQQAFGDQSLRRAQVFQWHARFKTCRTSVDNDEHTGRPRSCTTPENVARIQELVHQDRRQAIHNIAEEVRIGYGTYQWVFWQKNLACTVSQPNLCPGSWQLTRSSSASMSALNFVSSSPMMKPSCPGSSLAMTAGFTVTILKKSNNPPSGKAPHHQGQKKPDRWKAMSRGLCTKNLSQQAILWIPGSTATFCGNCVKTSEDVTPNFGEKRPGCFTMTMPHLTLLSSRSSFWWKTKWLSSPTHHTPLIWHLVTSSYFQKRNWSWKDAGLIPIESQRVFDTLVEKDFQEAFQKWRRRWDRYLHAGGNYFKGDSSRQALWWVLWFLQRQSGKFWIPPRIANLNQINHIRLARGVLTNMWIAMHNSMYWLWKPFHSRYKKTEANSHSGSQDPTF